MDGSNCGRGVGGLQTSTRRYFDLILVAPITHSPGGIKGQGVEVGLLNCHIVKSWRPQR